MRFMCITFDACMDAHVLPVRTFANLGARVRTTSASLPSPIREKNSLSIPFLLFRPEDQCRRTSPVNFDVNFPADPISRAIYQEADPMAYRIKIPQFR